MLIFIAIYYRNDRFSESLQERQFQLDGYRKLLDVHPSTAKCLHYLGLAHLKIGLFRDAQTCCLVAHQMYHKLYGSGVQTMTVFSDYGRVFLEFEKIELGVKYLEKALIDAENILGEHERVAWCYEELAAAKQKLFKDSEEVEMLRNKAEKIREQYRRKSRASNDSIPQLLVKDDDIISESLTCIRGGKFEIMFYISFFFNILLLFLIGLYACNRYFFSCKFF